MSDDAASRDATADTLITLRSRPTALLRHYIRRHAFGHVVILAAVLGAVLCAVGTQYGLKRLVDAVTQGRAAGAGPAWSAFVVLCGLIAADNLLWRLGGVVAAHTFVAVSGDVRRDLFAHLSGHAPSYFAERLPGALASRISATANAIFTALNTGAWNVLPPCIAVCVSIALVITVNPVMAATLGVGGLLLAGLIFVLARRGVPLHHAYATRAAALDGELVDVVGNMGVVRAFGATLRERDRMADSVGQEMAARRASLLYLERLRLIHAVVTALMAAGLIAWGLHLWDIGQASPGDIVLIASLGLTILNSTRDLAVALVDLTQHVARLQEATQALLLPHTLPDADGAPALRHAQGREPGRVVFDHVAFAYTGRAPVLRDFNLAIEAGTRVGLVGASGAGKSTVLALLQRFYDAQSGRILIDGQDITRVTQDSLHQLIAVVPQDVSLFHRSVLENIRYARPEASEAEVLHAAAMAQCGFLEALPEGYETIVGDRGTKLSGGQRQRLAIARAILKDAPILLLDEATSALDSESERAIQTALDNLMRGRTVVAVAHRLSTLQSFDRIIVMDQGRIIDDGSPRALAGRPGPYRDRLRLQDQLPVAA
jgi:ATP-binding cassette subfamily B protein